MYRVFAEKYIDLLLKRYRGISALLNAKCILCKVARESLSLSLSISRKGRIGEDFRVSNSMYITFNITSEPLETNLYYLRCDTASLLFRLMKFMRKFIESVKYDLLACTFGASSRIFSLHHARMTASYFILVIVGCVCVSSTKLKRDPIRHGRVSSRAS